MNNTDRISQKLKKVKSNHLWHLKDDAKHIKTDLKQVRQTWSEAIDILEKNNG